MRSKIRPKIVGGLAVSAVLAATSLSISAPAFAAAPIIPSHTIVQGIDYQLNADGTATVYSGKTAVGAVSIPSAVSVMIGQAAAQFPVTSVGAYAFYGSAMTSVSLPDSVTVIGYSAFEEDIQLTSVALPSTVVTIPNWLFWGDRALKSIVIPKSVTSFGYGSFSVSGVQSVIFLGDAPAIPYLYYPYYAPFYNDSALLSFYHSANAAGFGSSRWQGYPSIALADNVAPSFAAMVPLSAGVADAPYSYVFRPSSLPLASYSITKGWLPDGLTLSATGEISGTPTVSGTYKFSVTASNGIGRDATVRTQIVVAAGAVAVIDVTAARTYVRSNTSVVFTTKAWDAENNSVGNVSSSVTLTSDNPLDTVTANAVLLVGVGDHTITAKDGAITDFAVVTVH